MRHMFLGFQEGPLPGPNITVYRGSMKLVSQKALRGYEKDLRRISEGSRKALGCCYLRHAAEHFPASLQRLHKELEQQALSGRKRIRWRCGKRRGLALGSCPPELLQDQTRWNGEVVRQLVG